MSYSAYFVKSNYSLIEKPDYRSREKMMIHTELQNKLIPKPATTLIPLRPAIKMTQVPPIPKGLNFYQSGDVDLDKAYDSPYDSVFEDDDDYEANYEDVPSTPAWASQLNDEIFALINDTDKAPKLVHLAIEFNAESEFMINQILEQHDLPYAWLNGNAEDDIRVLSGRRAESHIVKCLKAPSDHYLRLEWQQQTAGTIWLWISPHNPDRSKWGNYRTLPFDGSQLSEHEKNHGTHIRLVNATELENQIRELSGDVKLRDKFVSLKPLGDFKRMIIADETHFANIKQLRAELPQHQKLLTLISNRIKIQAAQFLPLYLGRLLLAGPAGNGKSWLCEQIAKALDLPILSLQLAGSNDMMTLRGSERQWSNSDAGRPVRFMAECPVANPIIMIDEVDKMGSSHNGNPVDTLLMLLEPENAKRFMDNFISTPINMSHVSYILTANDIDRLSEPLRSRLELNTIEPPSLAEMLDMIQLLYRQLLKQHNLTDYFVEVIAPEHVEVLQQGDCSIRALKQRINAAIENGVDEVESPEALRQLIGRLHIKPNRPIQPPKQQAMGFI